MKGGEKLNVILEEIKRKEENGENSAKGRKRRYKKGNGGAISDHVS